MIGFIVLSVYLWALGGAALAILFYRDTDKVTLVQAGLTMGLLWPIILPTALFVQIKRNRARKEPTHD